MLDIGPDADAGSLGRAAEIRGALLMCFGRLDPHVPAEGRTAIEAALRDAGRNATVKLYDGEHAFMRDEGPRYDPEATDEAFADYTKFLNMVHEALPKTRVIITSVKIGEKRAAQIPQVHELNRMLQSWSKERDWTRYVDCTSYLADADGKPIRKYYRDDLLHLSPEGYAEWKAILDPILREEWAKVQAKG